MKDFQMEGPGPGDDATFLKAEKLKDLKTSMCKAGPLVRAEAGLLSKSGGLRALIVRDTTLGG